MSGSKGVERDLYDSEGKEIVALVEKEECIESFGRKSDNPSYILIARSYVVLKLGSYSIDVKSSQDALLGLSGERGRTEAIGAMEQRATTLTKPTGLRSQEAGQVSLLGLPDELLQDIILRVHDSVDPTANCVDPLPVPPGIPLSHISRRFRRITLHTRRLWSTTSTQYPLEMLEAFHIRSETAPMLSLMDLMPFPSIMEPWGFEKYCSVFFEDHRRWTKLYITVRFPEPCDFEDVTYAPRMVHYSFPRLKKLAVQPVLGPFRTEVWKPANWDMPVLEVLKFRAGMLFMPFLRGTLREVAVHFDSKFSRGTHSLIILGLLMDLPLLEELSLTFGRWESFAPFSLSSTIPGEVAVFPSLKEFSLTIKQRVFTGDHHLLMSLMRVPKLERLHIDFVDILRTETLRPSKRPDGQMIDFLDSILTVDGHLPNLNTFTIAYDGVFAHRQEHDVLRKLLFAMLDLTHVFLAGLSFDPPGTHKAEKDGGYWDNLISFDPLALPDWLPKETNAQYLARVKAFLRNWPEYENYPETILFASFAEDDKEIPELVEKYMSRYFIDLDYMAPYPKRRPIYEDDDDDDDDDGS